MLVPASHSMSGLLLVEGCNIGFTLVINAGREAMYKGWSCSPLAVNNKYTKCVEQLYILLLLPPPKINKKPR